MVFNGIAIEGLVIFVLLVWVVVLSVIIFRTKAHYNRLTGGKENIGLKEVLESLMANQRGLKNELKALSETLDGIKKDGSLHVQRVGLVRFNPFSDTGGSQSFTLAILDGHNNGLIMTSLYARTGHRWYVKEVVGSKGKELALSREEQQAIQKAKPFEGEQK